MITDFFDAMKSRSKGYASMEYSLVGYRPNDLVRLDILINGEVSRGTVAVQSQSRYSHGTVAVQPR